MTSEDSTSRAPLAFLPTFIRGLISMTVLALNTLGGCLALLPLALVKLILPVRAVRRKIDPMLHGIARIWIAINGVWIRLVHDMRWTVRGVEGLRRDGWYLVEANHQSWADIFVMQRVFNDRIPLLKFSLKRELIWVPLIGLAWWALDFPFMSRYSEAYLRKRPERRGKDLEAIRKACEKFRMVPTSVMNFLEGTRFTPAKQRAEGSPYRHLLRPKTGGIALALDAMGERFQSLLDVTLFYPAGPPSFFGFLAGGTGSVVVLVEERPIPEILISGDYSNDPDHRSRIRAWVDSLWQEKDRTLEELQRRGETVRR